jgi:hypothetical protein
MPGKGQNCHTRSCIEQSHDFLYLLPELNDWQEKANQQDTKLLLARRCQGLVSDVADAMDSVHNAASATATASASRPGYGESDAGCGNQNFTVGSLLSYLHMQPYDAQMKQKISTGLLAQVLIPDTIAFRPGDPTCPAWYLSSKADPGVYSVMYMVLLLLCISTHVCLYICMHMYSLCVFMCVLRIHVCGLCVFDGLWWV